jgi:hypothetical protein
MFELGRKPGRRHVVAGAPQLACIVVAEFLCPDVLKFDEARIFVFHRRTDRVPAQPEPRQLFRVVRFGHEGGNLVDLHALRSGRRLLSPRRVGAVLALPVHAGEFGRELCLLGKQIRFARRSGRRDLQEVKLAAQLRRKLEVIETVALRSQRQRARGGDLVHARRSRFRVFGDVGLGGPFGMLRVHIHLEQFGVGAIDESLGVRNAGRTLRGRLLCKERKRTNNREHDSGNGKAHGGSINPRAAFASFQ